jgi:Flp pilus assembly protein TadD
LFLTDSEFGGGPTPHARPRDGERALRRAIADDPENAEFHHRLGTVLHGARRFDEALSAFERACALDPSCVESHHNLGIVHAELSRTEAAERAFRRAIQIDPDYIEAYYNLAGLFHRAGAPAKAAEILRAALRIRPDIAILRVDLGTVLSQDGRHEEAVAELRDAVRCNADIAETHHALATAYRNVGRIDDCVASFRTAAEIKPNTHTLCSLGVALFREDDRREAESVLIRAVSLDIGNWMALFYLGVIRDLDGDAAAASRFFARAARHGAAPHRAVESWRYIQRRRGPATRQCRSGFELLGLARDAAPPAGLVLEFGVWNGASIRFIAGGVAGPVHGFDSFQGLPEAWAGEAAGSYSTGGRLPEAPDNVALHVGLFADTLPRFLAAHDGPVRFMNIDCDSHGSTKTVLDALAARVAPGTVIAFDEYFMYGAWKRGEFRAFQQAVHAHGWAYEYIAYNLYSRQVAVRILD